MNGVKQIKNHDLIFTFPVFALWIGFHFFECSSYSHATAWSVKKIRGYSCSILGEDFSYTQFSGLIFKFQSSDDCSLWEALTDCWGFFFPLTFFLLDEFGRMLRRMFKALINQ